jgi:LPXTG-site transpeptidase (sortase) family protein
MKFKTTKLWGLILAVIQIAVITTSVSAQTYPELYGAVEQTWITPYPENPGANFGNAIAFFRDTLVVGSRNDSTSLSSRFLYGVGAVYVYKRDSDTWVQQARLTPKDPQAGENFGVSVAIYDDTIVVGASGRDLEDKTDIGVAYVFTRNGDEWIEQARIEPAGGEEGDYFGTAVAISGNRLVVGAEGKDIGEITDAGKVYTFYRSGNKWIEKQSITASSPVADGSFGYALALEGARLVVGAPSKMDIGAAYIFYRNGGTWLEESIIEPDDDKIGDRFGTSVAIDRGMVVVGAPYADPDSGNGPVINGGAVYVFTHKPNTWQQSAKIVPDNGRYFDHFGRSLAISQKAVVVGAPGYDHFAGSDAGAAYLFKLMRGEWVFQTRVVASHPDQNSHYGASVTLDSDRIVVGKPGPTTQAGAIYIYSIKAGMLPETGFAPGTLLIPPKHELQKPPQDETMRLEIPGLSVEAGIVGIPREGNGWDVSWLGNTVGYLESTAFPLWNGNTVLSGHVSLPGGNPGPFSEIHKLRWGDQIIIHANGYAYKYVVREVFQTSPGDLNVLDRSNDYDWLTLITCSRYDPEIKTYKSRTVIVAVRIE